MKRFLAGTTVMEGECSRAGGKANARDHTFG